MERLSELCEEVADLYHQEHDLLAWLDANPE